MTTKKDDKKLPEEKAEAEKARRRIEARKWYASRINPNKYGERLSFENLPKEKKKK
jgi:hypothetical protein